MRSSGLKPGSYPFPEGETTMSHNQLAATGVGTIVIGGLVLNSMWLVAGAFGLVGLGLLAVRIGSRRGRR